MPSDDNLRHIHPALRELARPVEELTPDPNNARVHDEQNLEAIRASMERFGVRQPLVAWDSPEGALVVLVGNGRLEVAKRLGWTHMPVIVVEDKEDVARAYALTDNRTAELAAWDYDALADALKHTLDSDADLVIGWDMDDVSLFVGDVGCLEPSATVSDNDLEGPNVRGAHDNHKLTAKTIQFTEKQWASIVEAFGEEPTAVRIADAVVVGVPYLTKGSVKDA